MAPVTRKRKEPPANCTLRDFFSLASATKRARAPRAPARSTQQTKMASGEVIVIDSDSDDGDHEKEDGKNNCRVESSPETEETSFGAPSELLRSTTPHAAGNASASYARGELLFPSEKSESESMFGASAPLLEDPRRISNQPTAEGGQNKIFFWDKVPTMADGGLVDCPLAGLSVGEWATTDDELFPLGVADNATATDDAEGESFCPVCGMELSGISTLEAETHANQCLDEALQTDNPREQECASIAMQIKPDLISGDGNPGKPAEGDGRDLYNILMKSHKENPIWSEADAATHHSRTRGNRRIAPFYKILQGMPIAVDAFCYGVIPGVTAYFLTHAHSDHYTSLGSKWSGGPIYCSEETASLIVHMLSVDPEWIHPLPLDTPTVVPNTGGVNVTLIEANHCPGSCLFVFEGQQTIDAGDSAFKSPFVGSPKIFRYLHCGDFRASPRHVLHPAVNGKHLDLIYLDTTYLDSKYTFSPQPLVVSACAELARKLVAEGDNPNGHTNQNSTLHAWMKPLTTVTRGGQEAKGRVLVIVGTYSIGKERIVKAIAQALGSKVYCDARKAAILRCQADKELHTLLTTEPLDADVHILPLGAVTLDNLRLYLQRFQGTFSRIVGFRPTGWTYSPPSGNNLANSSIQSIISRGQSRHFSYTDLQPSPKSSYDIQIFGVPYSEHSSFFELTCFAMSCDWDRIIPTVNVGSVTSRAKMTRWFKQWESEKRSARLSVIEPRTADYW